jgi:hypothetical protein
MRDVYIKVREFSATEKRKKLALKPSKPQSNMGRRPFISESFPQKGAVIKDAIE